MEIPSRKAGLYIGFPSSYISRYFTSVKFEFPLIASIIKYWLCIKTCFRDRGIVQVCMEHISEIGVLIGCA